MGLATFKGGVHPYEGKELAENKPVQVLEPKGNLVCRGRFLALAAPSDSGLPGPRCRPFSSSLVVASHVMGTLY